MSQISAYSDLMQLIMQQVPGCEQPLIQQHLQQAVRKFCHHSEAWLEKMQPMDLIEDQYEYTLTPNYDCEVRRVTDVWYRSADDVTNDHDGQHLQELDEYTFVRPNVLRLCKNLAPQADVTDGLVVKVVLVPFLLESGGNAISQDFLNLWAEPIVAGAIETLMMVPRTRWGNPNLAQYWRNIYLTGITDAKAAISMDGLNQPEGISG